MTARGWSRRVSPRASPTSSSTAPAAPLAARAPARAPPNHDGAGMAPQFPPARFPNILVTGAGGIAVGMATNIPPHNLGEVLAACKAYIANPGITIEELS